MKIILGEVGTYINGYAFKPSDWGISGLPIIRIQNLTNQNTIPNYFDGPYNSKFEVNKGDILIAWSGSLGIHVWQKNKALLNQHIFRVEFNKCEIDKMYFYYAVKYNIHKMLHLTHGATMRHIVKSDFEQIIIPYPSLDVQAKISKILNYLEQNIINYKTILSKLELLIKSRFDEMFGDPVINNKKWTSMNLQEISIKITSGNTPQGGSRVYINHGVLFIRSQNVWNNRLELDDVVYISESFNEKMKETRLRRNDILITKTGRFNTENSSLGRCALYTGPDFQANINGHVYLVRLKSEYNPNFILSILTSEAYKKLIRSVCVGGIDKRQLNKSHIELFPIIVPPIELQNQYIQFLSQINKLKFAKIVYN